MEKRNSQLDHGQPIEQTRGSFACATQVLLAVNRNRPTSYRTNSYVVDAHAR